MRLSVPPEHVLADDGRVGIERAVVVEHPLSEGEERLEQGPVLLLVLDHPGILSAALWSPGAGAAIREKPRQRRGTG